MATPRRGKVCIVFEAPVALHSAVTGIAQRNGVTLSDWLRRTIMSAVMDDFGTKLNSDGSIRYR